MTYTVSTPDEYIDLLPDDRKAAVRLLRSTIKENLPAGFDETMQYGMIGYVVPHNLYPAGYHVNPKEPLPFIGVASQKSHIALYHMGLYLFPNVLEWFVIEYPNHIKTKLDIGKSCIRFRNLNAIPYALIAELCGKITAADYIVKYEASIKSTKSIKKQEAFVNE